MAKGTRWWFRTEVVLTALKTENLLIAGCLPRMKISLVDGARLIECLRLVDVSFTEPLIAVFRDCRPEMLRQHPELSAVPNVDPKDFDAWLVAQKAKFGHWIDFYSRS